MADRRLFGLPITEVHRAVCRGVARVKAGRHVSLTPGQVAEIHQRLGDRAADAHPPMPYVTCRACGVLVHEDFFSRHAEWHSRMGRTFVARPVNDQQKGRTISTQVESLQGISDRRESS